MMVRQAYLVACLVLATACTGEQREAQPGQAAGADSLKADSTVLKGDSMMARDTARPQ